MTDDGTEPFRPHPFHDRFRKFDLFEVVQFFELALGLLRFYVMQFFFDEFHLDFPHVFLLLFVHALGNFLFQSFFNGLTGQHFGKDHFKLIEDIDDFVVAGHLIVRYVFVNETLQADQTAGGGLRNECTTRLSICWHGEPFFQTL